MPAARISLGIGLGKKPGLGLALSKEILSITGITIRETGEQRVHGKIIFKGSKPDVVLAGN